MGKTFPTVSRENVNSIFLVHHGKTVKEITYRSVEITYRSVLTLGLFGIKQAVYHWNKYLKFSSDI
jgi:hypothetical protein